MAGQVFSKIYEVVKRIPYGYVASYGQIATIAGNPRWARVVGYALHCNPDPDNIPCYRVVTKDGKLSDSFAFGGVNKQHEFLQNEGVEFLEDGRVDLSKFMWDSF